MVHAILNVLFYVWCAFCILCEGAAALAIFKKEGLFPGFMMTMLLATPWLIALL